MFYNHTTFIPESRKHTVEFHIQDLCSSLYTSEFHEGFRGRKVSCRTDTLISTCQFPQQLKDEPCRRQKNKKKTFLLCNG